MKSDSFDLRLSPRILIGKESFTPPVPAMPVMTPSGSSATLREEFKVKITTQTNRRTKTNKQTNKKTKQKTKTNRSVLKYYMARTLPDF